jgi:hypothetical protein
MDMYVLTFNAIIAGIMSIIGVPFCGMSQMFMRGIGALAFCEYSETTLFVPCKFFVPVGWASHCALTISIAVNRFVNKCGMPCLF